MGIQTSAANGRLALLPSHPTLSARQHSPVRRNGAPTSSVGARWRPPAAGVCLVLAAGLAVCGCGSNASSPAAACSSGPSAASTAASGLGTGNTGSSPNAAAAAGWTLPGGNLQNTRDVTSAITSANVSKLGVAWCVPIESTGAASAVGVTDGYSTTPVVVNGVVYLQDMESNVMAIKLATGKVLWTHNYSSPNGGPGRRQCGQRGCVRGDQPRRGGLVGGDGQAVVEPDADPATTTRASTWRPGTTTAPSTCRPCRSTRPSASISAAARGSCGR